MIFFYPIGSDKYIVTIIFKNGYSKNAATITIECKGIEIGKAKPEWSDNWEGDVFIIKLGNTLSPEDKKTLNNK